MLGEVEPEKHSSLFWNLDSQDIFGRVGLIAPIRRLRHFFGLKVETTNRMWCDSSYHPAWTFALVCTTLPPPELQRMHCPFLICNIILYIFLRCVQCCTLHVLVELIPWFSGQDSLLEVPQTIVSAQVHAMCSPSGLFQRLRPRQ